MATILIVDNRAMCREFLSMVLGYGHHRLLEASNGEEALAIIYKEKPDLMITDLLMPTINGYELVKKIKSNPEMPNMEIIFYTASYLLTEAKMLAQTCGVKYVLYMPSSPRVILDTIKKALAHIDAAELPDINMKAHESNHTFLTKNIFFELKLQLSTLIANNDTSCLSAFSHCLLNILKLCFHVMQERDSKKLLKKYCEEARTILGTNHCVIGIFHNDSSKIKHMVVSSDHDLMHTEINVDENAYKFFKFIIDADQTIQLNFDKINLTLSNPLPTFHSTLACKLIMPTHLYGFIYFTDKSSKVEFNDNDLKIVNLLAATLSQLYAVHDMYDTIQRHAASLQVTVDEYVNH